MRVILFLLVSLTLLISSCKSPEDKGQVKLFNNLNFTLLEGERNDKPNNFDLDSYTEIQSELGLEIPLYKVIKNEQYKIFIGMPYGLSFEDILKVINEAKGEGKITKVSETVQMYSQQWEDQNKSYSSIVYVNGSDMLYVLSSQATTSKSIALTSVDALAKRISKKTE